MSEGEKRTNPSIPPDSIVIVRPLPVGGHHSQGRGRAQIETVPQHGRLSGARQGGEVSPLVGRDQHLVHIVRCDEEAQTVRTFLSGDLETPRGVHNRASEHRLHGRGEEVDSDQEKRSAFGIEQGKTLVDFELRYICLDL